MTEPGKELTFFQEMAKGVTLSPEEQKQVDDFKKQGMDEERKGLPITFPRLTIVHQGAKSFRNESDDSVIPFFRGVIIHIEQQRVWWKNKFGQGPKDGPKLPECFSRDLERPDKESIEIQCATCAVCPNNEWESEIRQDGTQGKGKACREVRRVFVMMEGHLNPYWFAVPPSSLKSLGNYLGVLRDKKVPRPQAAVTNFSLVNAATDGGVVYSQLKLDFVAPLPDAMIGMIMSAKKEVESIVRVASPVTDEDIK